jgi:hypothetical protein
MVHNGIEYGMMAALAEGLSILKKADIGLRDHAKDAETTPLRDPHYYQYRFDMPEVAEGARTCLAVPKLAAECGVEAPIAEAVVQVLYEGVDVRDAVERLMMRTLRSE